MKTLPSYSVAIRTLGKAGEKYLATLQSCAAQTHRPEKIVVYLAEGFEKPKETIGIEQVVYVPKGMITQRCVEYDEIDSEFILLLDDDVRLAPDSVERLFGGLQEYNADCIAANMFANHRMTLRKKIVALFGGTYPHWRRNWAFRIRSNSNYSYNNNPHSDVLLTQSFAGAAILVRKSALLAIHFEDERWLESYGYAYGDDQLLGNKLYKNGYKVLVHYNSGIENLDAQTGRVAVSWQQVKNMGEIRYLLMYRGCYNLKNISPFGRLWCLVSFWLQVIPSTMLYVLRALRDKNLYPIAYVQGAISGGVNQRYSIS